MRKCSRVFNAFIRTSEYFKDSIVNCEGEYFGKSECIYVNKSLNGLSVLSTHSISD